MGNTIAILQERFALCIDSTSDDASRLRSQQVEHTGEWKRRASASTMEGMVQVCNPDEPGMGHNFFGWRALEPHKFYSAPAVRTVPVVVPIVERHLRPLRGGLVLEIGSGSGQHMTALAEALSSFTFQPTEYAGGRQNPMSVPQDIDKMLGSIAAYCREQSNVLAPMELDAAGFAGYDTVADGSLVGMIALNVIHVAPPSVLQGILAGAAAKLVDDGWLFLYGPFMRDGVIEAEGNQKFHHTLQTLLGTEYGLRDISTIRAAAAAVGLELVEECPCPANNLVLCLQKSRPA
jgi:hypothetical protein